MSTTTDPKSLAATPCSDEQAEEDPYQSEDYQKFLAECAKECTCSHGICDSVLAGGVCEEIHDYHDDM